MSDAVRRIKDKIPIENLIGRWVKLKRKGQDYQGLCPFHKEKTPSFHISSQKGLFHCFGCQAGGDIFEFLQKIESIDFKQALAKLAVEAGISLEKTKNATVESFDLRQNLLLLIKKVHQKFEKQLVNQNNALEHLSFRGISKTTKEEFALGWCPDTNSFMNMANQNNWSIELLVKAGLLISEPNMKPYARFHNRLIIPIYNNKQEIIAFGGRALDKRPARYINSPETILFQKRYNLFHSKILSKSVSKKNRLLVVEGYFDVMALHQAGFPETCASLGTAISSEQLRLLWQLHKTPILCFDGDNAGYSAMLRLAKLAIQLVNSEQYIKFMHIPKGFDPDSLLQNTGARDFENLISKAELYSKFLHNCANPVSIDASREDQASYLTRWQKLIVQVKDKNYKQALQADWYDKKKQMFFGTQYNKNQNSLKTFNQVNYLNSIKNNTGLKATPTDKEASYSSPEFNKDELENNRLSLVSQKLLLLCLLENIELLDLHVEALVNINLNHGYNKLLKAMLDFCYLHNSSEKNTNKLDKNFLINYLEPKLENELKSLNSTELIKLLPIGNFNDCNNFVLSFIQESININQIAELRQEASKFNKIIPSESEHKLAEKITWLSKNIS